MAVPSSRKLTPRLIGILLFALGSFALLVHAQEPPAGTPIESRDSLAVSVVDSVTGDPVPNALVILGEGPAQHAAFTDGIGAFKFKNLPAQRTSLQAFKPGFINPRENALIAAEPVMVEIGPNTSPVVLKLVPEALITGRVLDASGEPLEDIEVNLKQSRILNGRMQCVESLITTANATTNDEGEFRFAKLPPGSYYVVSGPGWNARQTRPGMPPGALSFPPVYYPDAQDPATATALSLIAGQHLAIGMVLKPVPAVRVSGVVIGVPEHAAYWLSFTNPAGDEAASFMRKDAGKFEARVMSGCLCLVQAHAYDPSTLASFTAEKLLNVTQDVTDLRLDLAPWVTIPVIVQIHVVGEAVEGTSIPTVGPDRMPDAMSMLSVVLQPMDRLHFQVSSNEKSDEGKPALYLRGVPPGTYTVEAQPARAPWYVESITYGDEDLLHHPITVLPGATQPIEIELRNDSAQIAGTVEPHEAGKRATIVAIRQKVLNVVEAKESDERGAFLLEGLAPGDYQVFAFDSDQVEFRNPDAMLKYATRAVLVSVGAGMKESVRLAVIRTGE